MRKLLKLLVILLIISIIVSVLIYKKETFISTTQPISEIQIDSSFAEVSGGQEGTKSPGISGYTGESPTGTCEFYPFGVSEDACTERCYNRNDRELWGGESCTYEECSRRCRNCRKDGVSCWLQPDQVEAVEGKVTLPAKVTINAIAGNGKIVVLWKAISIKNNPVTGFVVQYFKTYKPFEGVRLINVNLNDKGSYRLIISDLVNNEYYSVGVYSINRVGTSEISNVEIVVPTDKLIVSM